MSKPFKGTINIDIRDSKPIRKGGLTVMSMRDDFRKRPDRWPAAPAATIR